MALIQTARMMDDADFRWRVMAAMARKAREEFLKGAGTTAVQQRSHRFAQAVLINPMSPELTMFALVALDQVVSSAVVLTDGDTVDTSKVTDTDIIRVVDAEWPNVALKY